LKRQRPNRQAGFRFIREPIEIIESNVDDVTGEILSRTVERMFSEGAYDCTLVPLVAKKGRPGFTIRVVTSKNLTKKLADTLVRETGTMGVKVIQAERWRVYRRSLSIPVRIGNFNGTVSVKVVESENKVVRIKPEADEIKEVSDLTGLSMRQVEDLVKLAASEFLKNERARKT
jgi:pyridinium-3,5-bisthiocarboxylic acid mononucleotide nickel chelatase